MDTVCVLPEHKLHMCIYAKLVLNILILGTV